MNRLVLILFALAAAVVALLAITAPSPPVEAGGDRAVGEGAQEEGGQAGSTGPEAVLELVVGGTERVDGHAPVPAIERDPTIPAGRARLIVELVSGNRGFGGCQVRFADPALAELEVRGGGGRVGVTDEDGRVSFIVAPERTLGLEVAPLGTSTFERWSTNSPAEGTTRVFSIPVPLRTTRPYALHVVDRGTGGPIGEASVTIQFHDRSRTKLVRPVDGNGGVGLQLPMHGTLTISAPGYHARTFPIEPEGPTATGRICLTRPAVLHGTVPEELLGKGLEIRALGVRGEGESGVRDEGWPAEGQDAPPPLNPDRRPKTVQYRSEISDDGRWRIEDIQLAPHAATLHVAKVAVVGRREASVLAGDIELTAGQSHEVVADAPEKPSKRAYASLRDMLGTRVANPRSRVLIGGASPRK